MNVQTIDMPKEEAKERYDAYREALRGKEISDEDRGILLGYQALANGRSILNLDTVFRNCPMDKRRPKLAIARAHWRMCWFKETYQDAWIFASQRDFLNMRTKASAYNRIRLSRKIVTRGATMSDSRTVVPIVPPNLRPIGSLEKYFILWEAEWETMPTDPMLLSRIRGNMFAVLAVWDLTELERLVLSGRIQTN